MIATYFLSETHLGHTSASRSISHQTTVAHFSDFRIEQRTYHKASTQLQVKSGSSRINDRTYSHSHFRTLLCRVFHNFRKYFMSKVTTVCKFECTNSAVITSFHHFLCHFCIFMVEYRNHAG